MPSLADRPEDSFLSSIDDIQDCSSIRFNVGIIYMTFDVDNTIAQEKFNNDDSFFFSDADYSFFKPNNHLPKPLNFPIVLFKIPTTVKVISGALFVLSIIKFCVYISANLWVKSSRFLKLLCASNYIAVQLDLDEELGIGLNNRA